MHRLILITSCLFSACLCAQHSSPTLISPQKADTWAATDALGRSLPGNAEVGDLDKEKYVGIFYFTWLGAHGHDKHSSPIQSEGVMPKEAGKDYKSPYDISKILAEHPDEPQYGPELAFHHWGEPYFGYYLSDDEWVITRHAQLLSDAGVDVIVFDVTNAVVYLPIALKICTVFSRLQQQGWAVPKVAFLTNTRHVETTEKLYAGFYERGLYEDLWFRWKGKPLLMGNPEGLPTEIARFFNFRRSWAWTEGQEWFGDGKDKWPWIDHYPQNYGWHDNPDTPEQIVVSTAQHPISNIGRSFHHGSQPPADSIDSGAGWFFAEQWKRALEVDPEFVFITGWNEWVAMRFTDGRAKEIMGKPIKKGETFFVDQYNEEFSRDIEPMKGGFGDNYYYQMIDGIRKFKGARPLVQSAVDPARIILDGSFNDWDDALHVYHDHTGDITDRHHPGWGSIDAYTNASGRNDLLESRLVETNDTLSFYLRTAAGFSGGQLPHGLTLYLKTSQTPPGALGYDYRIMRSSVTIGEDPQLIIEKAVSSTRWTQIATLPYALTGNELELSLSKVHLPNPGKSLEFKWADAKESFNDPMSFYDQGDCAPNARFNYRYLLNSNNR
ncbi:hypothetical protein FUA23_19620 [Neolewinella aurantiaca]|uniref:Uncharacterized protein n=1 Tax=Neolewinella aurantiaca TaxID=2602767 RepID=A0A5C7F9V3_9BACT|nr:hypothetical protein [Neolewinella aurantiaca]TXF86330.1 hypothetical protein FUA23_19620 [Neolewinella aurantiaca]